ncbi:MAG: hypothetical protein B7O98_08155 [Zestosphaera tikiterensis]|uniref:Ferrous iron transporter FeoA-like domain-containing protein n=1 Tax=Zestosphaera tikiterensis TaxID=1973259 RepID=A0A2R7Y3F3_9CREN|nr:MAG: hypothetical protein B7O98_08155 [Zestosphaera tikiterensis]
MIPLSTAQEGSLVRVVNVMSGKGLMLRLAELGITPGSIVRVVKVFGSGPILLDVKGSRIAIGRGAAMKIFVEVIGGER